MSMGYLLFSSVSSLPSEIQSFHCRSPSLPRIGVFLDIYFLETVVNGSVSMISSLYLWWRCIFESYWFLQVNSISCHILEFFIISGSFLIQFWGSLTYSIMLSVNIDRLNILFPIYIPLVSSICLFAPASILSTLLKMCGDNEHRYFFPKLSGVDSSFSPSRQMLTEGFLYVVSIVLRCAPSSLYSLELLW